MTVETIEAAMPRHTPTVFPTEPVEAVKAAKAVIFR